MIRRKTHGIITQLEMHNLGVKAVYWTMFVIVLLISLACIFPPIWVIVSGFKGADEFLRIPPTIFPESFHPEKLILVWNKTSFLASYVNTLYLAAGELAFCLLLNGLAGYVLSRLRPRGTALISMVILWTMMMPTSVSMVPLYMTFISFPIIGVNLTDSFIPLFLMAGANAFYVLLFKNFYDGISMEFLESARMDGATNLGIFFKIILPLSLPIIIVVSIFVINGAWGSFFWPYLLLKDKSRSVVSILIYKIKNTFSIDEYMVALTFVITPPAIIYVFLQKHIIGGLTLGGVKG